MLMVTIIESAQNQDKVLQCCRKTQDLSKLENIKKMSKLHGIIAQCLVLSKFPEKQKLNICRSALLHMKTGVCLKYFVNHFLWKQSLASHQPHTTSNLICLTIFVNLRPLKQFQPKVRATNLQKSAKIFLT